MNSFAVGRSIPTNQLELCTGVIVLNHFFGQNFHQLTAENLKLEPWT